MTGTPHSHSGSRARRHLWLLLRVAVTAGALAWTLSRVQLEALSDAAARIPPAPALGALALTYANLFVGAVRWRALLAAYDAERPPSVLRLAHIYLVAMFYNTFLPANVGGDLVRGFVLRNAFSTPVASYLIVFIERIFGLAGLLLLSAGVSLVQPIVEVPSLPWLAGLGLAAAAAAASTPVLGRRIGRRLPGRLGSFLARMPAVRAPRFLGAVLALSVGTQTVLALTGYLLLSSIAPTVTTAQALVLVPVALAAMYLPTIAGLGAREAAFVLLFGAVGVAEADATAASLALFAAQLLVALTGGLTHVARRL